MSATAGPSFDDLPDLLTVEEAAAFLRIGRSAAYNAARSGDLPGTVRIGRSVRVSKYALAATFGLNDQRPDVTPVAGETSKIAPAEGDLVPAP